jgi:multidrug efflux pump subunit AcrB
MNKAIAWFVDNPVAANLMMAIFLVGGFFSLATMHKEEFPNVEPGIVQINVPYLGAAPEEVEQAVCIRIEEAIDGVDGMERVTANASEGNCSVIVELFEDANQNTVKPSGWHFHFSKGNRKTHHFHDAIPWPNNCCRFIRRYRSCNAKGNS